jgi:hypothetical protein
VTTEPERTLVRRVAPFLPLAAVVAFVLGFVVGGPGVAWSALLGVVVVAANFAAAAFAMAWASRISPVAIYGVALGGFFVRLLIITLLLVGLDSLAWFSPLAFALTVVPATIAILVIEMRFLAGPAQADLWYFREQP